MANTHYFCAQLDAMIALRHQLAVLATCIPESQI
jgi:hypothetical protein